MTTQWAAIPPPPGTPPAGPFGSIYIRPSVLDESAALIDGKRVIEYHQHNHDHVMFIHNNNVLVECRDTEQKVVIGPRGGAFTRHCLIRPETIHRATSLAPSYAEALAGAETLSREQVNHLLAQFLSAPPIVDCVFGHRDAQGQIVEVNTGWEHAWT